MKLHLIFTKHPNVSGETVVKLMMELFVMFLSIVVGHVCGVLEGKRIGRDDLRFDKPTEEALSRLSFNHDKIPINIGQKIQKAKDHKGIISGAINARSKGAESREIETWKSPSPEFNLSRVTPSSSNTTKNWLSMHLETPPTRFQILNRKLVNCNVTRPDVSEKSLNSSGTVTDLMGCKETIIPRNTRKLLRRKRVYDPNDPVTASIEKERKILDKLPKKLRYAISGTDHYEHFFLLESVTTHDRKVLDEVFVKYERMKHIERKLLKKLVKKAGPKGAELIANYKALRKGEAWEFNKLSPTYVSFFKTPSALLTEYENLRRSELDIDSYLNGTLRYPEDDEPDEYPEDEEDQTTTAGQEAGLEETKQAETRQIEETRVTETESAQTTEAEATRAEEVEKPKSEDTKGTKTDNSITLKESYDDMQFLLKRLPEVLKNKFLKTDDAEQVLLDYYAKSQSVPNEALAAYNFAKQDERELLKRVLAEAETYGTRILQIYKLVRKGKAWTYIKLNDKFQAYFQQPSAFLTEYEDLKRDEFESLDSFLSKPNQNSREEAEEVYRMVRAKAGVRSRTQEDEKTDEMEHKERAERTDTRRGEKAAKREKAGDIIAPTQNFKAANDISRSTETVTSSDITNTMNSARTIDGADFVEMAILLSGSIVAALVILLLGYYRKEIMEWYGRNRMARSTPTDEEKEPLNPRRKVPSA